MSHRALLAAELLFVLAWTSFVAAPYLNLDPRMIPAGREFLGVIATHHAWLWARDCGPCAFWFGSVAGGFPVAADPVASTLHPLVALATLGWGVVNGAKLVLAGALLLAGWAQWWLARVLGAGSVARIWSACVAVAGGHLASRMELGSLGLVLSTATAAFVWPVMIQLSRTGRRRYAVVLGIVLASLTLSGTGYIQVGLLFLLPAAVVLAGRERLRLLRLYGVAVLIAILLASPLLVPFLHFLPEFAKDADPSLRTGQPLSYLPLNLVIDELDFYRGTVLRKVPAASMNALFIGWVPVLLAAWGLARARSREDRRAVLFLAATALLALWTASGTPQRFLIEVLPFARVGQLLSGVRYVGFIGGLAVPPILGLAAFGLQKLLDLRWPELRVSRAPDDERSFRLSLRWLCVVPLVSSIASARDFAKTWISLSPLNPDTASVVAELRTPDLQWVNPPYGEHFWIEPSVGAGLKLATDYFRTWHWRDRAWPEPTIALSRTGPPPGMSPRSVVSGAQVFVAPTGREYAAIRHEAGGRTVCAARGRAGDIDVVCNSTKPGVLTVRENSWSGWRARVDGQIVRRRPGQWLSVPLSAGNHRIEFRYRPWDVPLGALLGLAGVVLAATQWWRDKTSRSPRMERENRATSDPSGSPTVFKG